MSPSPAGAARYRGATLLSAPIQGSILAICQATTAETFFQYFFYMMRPYFISPHAEGDDATAKARCNAACLCPTFTQDYPVNAGKKSQLRLRNCG